ncbi:MAG TPA: endonuclease domain-containing protein [Rhizomicrobium sp.]|jgi:very-short-patch-repair endonuclease
MRAPVLTLKRARNLRRRMTLPEVILWQELRRGRLRQLHFRRQHPVGPYILDFFCSDARLAIEIDGSSHANEHQFRYDERRDRWLANQNIKVLRIGAADVLRDENLEDVLNCIEQAAAPSTAFGGPPPP